MLEQVYSLETYKRNAVIEGHRGSVLALSLSEDESLLFSSAGDRFVNVRLSAERWRGQLLIGVGLVYQDAVEGILYLLEVRHWRRLLRLVEFCT